MICIDCKKPYSGTKRSRRCPECAAKARIAKEKSYNGKYTQKTKVKTCQRCGLEKEMSPYGKYCPECRVAIETERVKKVRAGKKKAAQNAPQKKKVPKAIPFEKMSQTSQLVALGRRRGISYGKYVARFGTSEIEPELERIRRAKARAHI